jgi:hypothetical protein
MEENSSNADSVKERLARKSKGTSNEQLELMVDEIRKENQVIQEYLHHLKRRMPSKLRLRSLEALMQETAKDYKEFFRQMSQILLVEGVVKDNTHHSAQVIASNTNLTKHIFNLHSEIEKKKGEFTSTLSSTRSDFEKLGALAVEEQKSLTDKIGKSISLIDTLKGKVESLQEEILDKINRVTSDREYYFFKKIDAWGLGALICLAMLLMGAYLHHQFYAGELQVASFIKKSNPKAYTELLNSKIREK